MMLHSFDDYGTNTRNGNERCAAIPDHWSVRRVKDELLSLDHKRVPLSGEVRGAMTNPQFDYYGASGIIDQVDDYIFDEPLILIAEDGANLLSRNLPLVFIAQGRYWVNNHAHILKPYKGDLQFFCYLLESIDYTALISGAAQPKLTAERLRNLVFAVPPLPEQQAITAYLDAKTAQIDRKIDLLTQKASKYRQLRQSLINAAVTRGLDKSVPMKDSGVAWIGDVPAHWQMKRHKDCLSLVTSRCTDSSLMKVALENIEGQTGRYMPTDSAYDGVRFRVGDILFGKLRPYLAKVFLADFEGTAVGDIFVYRPQSSILPRFARQLMLSKRYLDVINSSTAGAKMPRVSADFISDLPVFTPSLLEQEAIIQYLDDKTGQIDQIIGAMDNQITKLKKLRKALVNDAITGKLKVT